MRLSFDRTAGRIGFGRGAVALAMAAVIGLAWQAAPRAQQGVDCGRLQALIARGGGGGGNPYARAARRQGAELARTQAMAHQLGCDRGGFLFFGGGGDNPQCPGLNARIQQLQASVGQMQAGGAGGPRADLVARFNAYCRGGQQPPHERGFFESLFGAPEQPQGPPPDVAPPPQADQADDDGGSGAHGGGQAVCVRNCDGGFFPLPISARHSADNLNEMCAALCPGTPASVYTRSPNAEIKTAMGLDGKPYMDMPNALKFQKEYTPACTCRPEGKSWAEALANAEDVIGHQRKGDILVTQEKSDELSRPKLDPKARAALPGAPGTAKVSTEDAGALAAEPPSLRDTTEVTGPDGVKRIVRRVGPQN